MCTFCDADSCTRFREENLMAKGQRMSKKQLLLPCGKNTVLMQRCNQASSVGKYITYSKSSHSKLSWKVYHILRINQSNSLGKSMLAKSYFKLLDSVPDPLALGTLSDAGSSLPTCPRSKMKALRKEGQ